MILLCIGSGFCCRNNFSGCFFLYSNFSFTGTLDAVTNDGLIEAVSGNAGIFIFLVELGIIVALING